MRSLRKSLKIVVSSIAIKFVMFFVCLPTEHLAVELKRVRAFQAVPDRTGTWKSSFLRRGEKSGVPGKSLSEQGRGPTTNSTHMVLICECFLTAMTDTRLIRS